MIGVRLYISIRGRKPGSSPKPNRSRVGLRALVCRAWSGLADPALLSFSNQQFQIFCKMISFHFLVG